MSTFTFRASLGFLAATFVAGAALAETAVVVSSGDARHVIRQKTVSYGDLDLSTGTGRAKLEQRVRFAVADVCDAQDLTRDGSIAYLNCYGPALRGAREELNAKLSASPAGAVTAIR